MTTTSRRSVLLALAAMACGAQGAPRAPEHFATPFALPLTRGTPLHSLGGLVLDADALDISGLSGLHLDSSLRLTAITDRARFVTARIVMEEEHPTALADLRTGHLRDGSGAPLARGYSGDAEALARHPDGTWLVGFERWHRIRAYRRLDGPGRYVEPPPGLERAPGNGGLEALTVLSDGRWFAIAESLQAGDASGARRAWLGGPGRWTSLAYRPAPEFDPSDAAALPDGGALVLERHFSIFSGFSGRLVRIPPDAVARAAVGTVLEGEEILRLAPPLPADNWEGVAVTRWHDRLLVALVSDDNGNPLQRTMLALFALEDA